MVEGLIIPLSVGLDHTDVMESIPVDQLFIGEKLFEIFFARGVALEEETGPFALGGKFRDFGTGFLFGVAFVSLISNGLEVSFGDLRELLQV